MIAFMRMNEKDPNTLNKKITFTHEFTTGKNPVFLSKSIQLGKSYTIQELLKYMISYSDNNATMLLNENLDLETFGKVFTDLGIEKPDWNAGQVSISAKDFSLFMKFPKTNTS